MKQISRHCPHCRAYQSIELKSSQKLVCPQCQAKWGELSSLADIFDHCPVCTCRQFYADKDFNQLIGFLFMGAAIILVPFTYGLSLPFFALLDWLLRKRIPSMIVCYRCGSEFRGFGNKKDFKPFMHPIGLKYDKYR